MKRVKSDLGEVEEEEQPKIKQRAKSIDKRESRVKRIKP